MTFVKAMFTVLTIPKNKELPVCMGVFDSRADAEYYIREYKKSGYTSNLFVQQASYSYY